MTQEGAWRTSLKLLGNRKTTGMSRLSQLHMGFDDLSGFQFLIQTSTHQYLGLIYDSNCGERIGAQNKRVQCAFERFSI